MRLDYISWRHNEGNIGEMNENIVDDWKLFKGNEDKKLA